MTRTPPRRLLVLTLVCVLGMISTAVAAPPALMSDQTRITDGGISAPAALFNGANVTTLNITGSPIKINASNDAPFEFLPGQSTFNGVRDDTFGFHYNRDGVNAGHPVFSIAFEGDYMSSADGPRLLEYHFNYESPSGNWSYRPISFDVNIDTHRARLHSYLESFKLGNNMSLEQFYVNTGTTLTGSDGFVQTNLPYNFQRNDAAIIQGRNAADNAFLELLRVDGGNRLVIGNGTSSGIRVDSGIPVWLTGSVVSANAIKADAADGLLKHFYNYPNEAQPRATFGNSYGAGGITLGDGSANAHNVAGVAIGATDTRTLSIATGNAGSFTERAKVTATSLQLTTVPLQLDALTQGTCDAAAAGQIKYVDDGSTSHFYGCKRTTGAYAWAQLD